MANGCRHNQETDQLRARQKYTYSYLADATTALPFLEPQVISKWRHFLHVDPESIHSISQIRQVVAVTIRGAL